MAWRLQDHVVRGEIDNRVRGVVTGKIWLFGREKPVELRLTGNAWRDLAGCHLSFENPNPQVGMLEGFFDEQTGVVGDLSVAQKRRIPEVSNEELMRCYEEKRPYPWHWENTIYLEWFSHRNGRVVIEGIGYKLTISEHVWHMSEAEEIEQRKANSAALTGFMDRVLEVAAQNHDEKNSGDEDFDDADFDPFDGEDFETEAEADARDAKMEKFLDRLQTRLENEGLTEENFDRIFEEEFEKRQQERNEPEPSPDELAEREARLAEFNADAEEALREHEENAFSEKLFPEKENRHPISERAMDFITRTRNEIHANPNYPKDAVSDDHPLAYLESRIMIACVKLAALLKRADDWPPPRIFCADKIVRLKKSVAAFDDANLALENCREESLATPSQLDAWAKDIAEFRHLAEKLITELRRRLQ